MNPGYVPNPKIGKGKIIIGVVLIILGIIYLTNRVTSTVGAILLIAGIGILLFGKFQHWWHWK